MTTRQEKIQYVVDLLREQAQSEINPTLPLVLSSDNCKNITPHDLIQVLELLEQQPECLSLEYRHRYHSEYEIHDELQEFKEIVSDMPGAYEAHVQEQLEIVDCSVQLLPDFDSGVQSALAGKNNCMLAKGTDIALRLLLDGKDQVIIRIIGARKQYRVKDLSRSSIYQEIMAYAEQHQNTTFKPAEICKNTYNTYDLLKRIFGSADIYKAFFTISGENGSELTANFQPTYDDLKAAGTSVQIIRDVLEDLKSK